MEKERYHYFYRITNRVNGKYYYGIHSTDNLDDNYMGSGTRICAARQKYGDNNFTKDILKFFNNKEEASEYEKQVVNENLLQDPKCYNLRTGGFRSDLNDGHLSEIVKEKLRKPKKVRGKGFAKSPEHIQKIVETKRRNGSFVRTEESKKKLSKARKGRVWMINEKERKQCIIPQNKIEEYKEQGFILGRFPREPYKKQPATIETKRKISETLQNKVWIRKVVGGKLIDRQFVTRGTESGWIRQGYEYGKELPKK